MSGGTVASITVGAIDSTGATIRAVYSKVGGRFAVYRTDERVMVQFADDQAEGAEQRQALSPLFALQGQINGLIDGWREHRNERVRAKAALFDRRVADALKAALIGGAAQAELDMKEIKADVLEERVSAARVDYVIVAAGAALAAILFACAMTSRPYRPWYDFSPEGEHLWLGFGAGALGALFFVCIALRARDMKTDLQPWENRVDAIARILIGAIAGIVIAAMLSAKFIVLTLGTVRIPSETAANAWLGIAVAAFAAGYAERLVSTLLNSAAIAGRQTAGNSLAGGGSTTTVTPPPGASETNPLGRPTPTPPPPPAPAPAPVQTAEENEADCCPADHEVGNGDETLDVELPPAAGGVEERR